jgi:hypothetical protein
VARTSDPSALSSSEAHEFRSFIRRIRDLKGLTNQDLSALTGWDKRLAYDRLTNSLRDGRVLLAATAYDILEAIGYGSDPLNSIDVAVYDFSDRAEWVGRFEALQKAPGALVPPRHIDRLAEILTAEIVGSRRVNKVRRHEIKSAIARRLRRDGQQMAEAWAFETYRRIALFVAEVDDGPAPWNRRVLGKIYDKEVLSVARGSVFKAALMSYPKWLEDAPTRRGV